MIKDCSFIEYEEVKAINEENKRRTPRLRTIPQAYEEIKKDDPDTAFTIRALRRMVNTGEIPTVAINSKKLINMALLFDHISCYNEHVFCVSDSKEEWKHG